MWEYILDTFDTETITWVREVLYRAIVIVTKVDIVRKGTQLFLIPNAHNIRNMYVDSNLTITWYYKSKPFISYRYREELPVLLTAYDGVWECWVTIGDSDFTVPTASVYVKLDRENKVDAFILRLRGEKKMQTLTHLSLLHMILVFVTMFLNMFLYGIYRRKFYDEMVRQEIEKIKQESDR